MPGPTPDTFNGIKKGIQEVASFYGIEVIGYLKLDGNTIIPADEMPLLKGVKYVNGEIDISGIKNPKELMPGAKSMVILGKKLLNDRQDISYQISKDYVASIEFMLLDIASQKISEMLKKEGYSAEDYTSYYLKVWAVLAGLGWIGKSRMFVSKTYGPRLRLKGILTDADLGENNKVLDDSLCGDCQECVKACPVKAISVEEVDRKKCGNCKLNHRTISDGVHSYCTMCTASCPVGKDMR
jgi:epoxyqueuosine reductase QueG